MLKEGTMVDATFAYSGQRDHPFWPIVTAAHAMVLRG